MIDNKAEEDISSNKALCAPQEPATLVSDADTLTKLLEMELALKRQQWQQRRSQRGAWRALSILFLLLIIGGALAAYFFFATNYRQSGPAVPSIEAKDSTR